MRAILITQEHGVESITIEDTIKAYQELLRCDPANKETPSWT